MTLQIAPLNWFSHNFTVTNQSQPVADIDVAWWGEKGALTIGGETYRMYREGWSSGPFILEQGSTVIARAEKPSFLRREFQIRHAGREYTLVARSAFRRGYVLRAGTRDIGSVEPVGFFSRKAAADLPSDLPLPLRMFIVWLVVIMWRREHSS